MEEYATWIVQLRIPEGESAWFYDNVDEGMEVQLDKILDKHLQKAKAEIDSIIQQKDRGFQVTFHSKAQD